MGDEHILSQDELDVLLGADAVGTSGRRIDLHTLQETFLLLFQSAGDALTQLLGEQVTFSVESAQVQSGDESIDSTDRQLGVRFAFAEAVHGEGTLVMDGAMGLSMARLLLEDDASDDEAALEPLGEAMQVVASSLTDSLMALLERNVSVTATLSWIDGDTQLKNIHNEEDDFAVFEVAIELSESERSLGHLVLPLTVTEDLMTELGKAAGEEEEPQPAEDEARSDMEPLALTADPSTESASGQTPPPPKQKQDAPAVRSAEFTPLETSAPEKGDDNLGLLMDVPLRLTVELGRAELEIREILALSKGQVIELDKLAGEPVDVFVNGKLIAKGEVVVMDENFAVKISHIVDRAQRVNNVQ